MFKEKSPVRRVRTGFMPATVIFFSQESFIQITNNHKNRKEIEILPKLADKITIRLCSNSVSW